MKLSDIREDYKPEMRAAIEYARKMVNKRGDSVMKVFQIAKLFKGVDARELQKNLDREGITLPDATVIMNSSDVDSLDVIGDSYKQPKGMKTENPKKVKPVGAPAENGGYAVGGDGTGVGNAGSSGGNGGTSGAAGSSGAGGAGAVGVGESISSDEVFSLGRMDLDTAREKSIAMLSQFGLDKIQTFRKTREIEGARTTEEILMLMYNMYMERVEGMGPFVPSRGRGKRMEEVELDEIFPAIAPAIAAGLGRLAASGAGKLLGRGAAGAGKLLGRGAAGLATAGASALGNLAGTAASGVGSLAAKGSTAAADALVTPADDNNADDKIDLWDEDNMESREYEYQIAFAKNEAQLKDVFNKYAHNLRGSELYNFKKLIRYRNMELTGNFALPEGRDNLLKKRPVTVQENTDVEKIKNRLNEKLSAYKRNIK
jgi:hypothetical protein